MIEMDHFRNNRVPSHGFPDFVIGRKISVITSLNGVTTARIPSVIVKDEIQDTNSDGASNVSSTGRLKIGKKSLK